jgi:thimet oligopeptidase
MKTPADDFLDECRGHIDAARGLRAQILAAGGPRTVHNTLEPYNALAIHLGNAGQRAALLSEVHPDPAFRATAEQCVRDVSSYQTEISQDPALHAALTRVDVSRADEVTRRMVAHTLRDFRRAGVDKDEATRKRVKDLWDAMTATGLAFDRNIREDVRRVRLDPAQLAGLPDDYVRAHPPGPDGKVTITTDAPDVIPFRAYAEDAAARRALYLAVLNRGHPANDEVLRGLLAQRRELATTLGYEDWADYDTEPRMIRTGQAARDFIDKISRAADERARHDYAELLASKRKDDPQAEGVEDWERWFYAEKVRREQHAFDSQAVRPYFGFAQTLEGLLAITARMYGIEYRPAPDAPRWDASVDVYDVYDVIAGGAGGAGGERVGRVYLDLHPREGKYKHAAQFPIASGIVGEQAQWPEGALVCNFPDPKNGDALMSHEEVVTMFHEFGHLMHHIFAGQQRWALFSGVATEWDFVEAPSQMFEEWAWDPAVLATFARHKDTKQPIPAELVKKMRRAQEFGKGSDARQQMFFAALSLRLHQEGDPAKIDFPSYTKDLQAKYGLFPFVEGTHFYDNFGHLNGYGASYYTYMWSLVIAKDLLTAFKEGGLMDATIDRRYRDLVLAPGGSKDAAVLVKDFLGRDYQFGAYEAWLNEE